MKINGSKLLIEALIEQGVDTIFGYPGGAVINIYDALFQNQDRIKHVITAHEQGAAHAADGYARATGKTGVVLATSGPGATNIVTGIATANMDSVPVVAITGNVHSSLIGLDSFQEVDIAGIAMPITKHTFVVRDVNKLHETIRQAFRIANSGRPGVVLVDITKDVTIDMADFEPKEILATTPNPILDMAKIKELANVINNASSPAILFGGGVLISNAENELLELSKRANIPCSHTLMGAGIMSWGEKLNLGLVGMHGSMSAGKTLQQSDVMIAIGTRFSDRVATDKTKFAPKSKVIHIDIDEAEINKNVASDIGIVGDVKEVLTALLPMINCVNRDEWIAQVDKWREGDYKPNSIEGVLRPHEIVDCISNAVGDDGIIVTDVGQHQMWTAQYSKRVKPRSFLTSGGLGTMGYGLGGAIGAQMACPDRRVVLATGDGSFHMNLNEMCTCVKNNLPIVVVVFNNHVLGMVRQWQTQFFEKRYAETSIDRSTDYVKLAEAFGAKGFRANTKAELEIAIAEAFKSGGPCIIDAIIDKDEKVLPMIPAGKTIDDIILN